MRRRAILATVLAAVGFAGVAEAQVAEDLVNLTVVDQDTGQPLRVWRHKGRAYVAGQPGARYGLRVTNNTGARLLVVMSVDGVNVLTGQTAGYGQRGYVFDPYQSYDVSGWRKSDSEIAAFNFAPLPKSYAARTGRPGDVGVIGVAVFKERIVLPAPAPMAAESRSSARDDMSEIVVTGSRVAPSARARSEEKLGTGHGARERSIVTAVAFERATAAPQLVRQIEYDTYDNLAALGVIRRPQAPEPRPRPFPAPRTGYVPDPPGMP
ncbi:MAG: hypothetical protein KKE02_23120 [Alphaproteobacteria bacterium]|nr:hypothetical protein [Alphaproteobacteria bacterium]MBU1517129.1 hypothetical protein [Alphaproteobacteria bacterium]MBU2093748.1 hypothetical protein [Alphaproteobacteria bacterium]MBU2153930.1 hypothetical protein [Alphaproteobacteria bacterium]MBU2308652.1 hypothetical protein [Alphaproteobacteria bacterium]